MLRPAASQSQEPGSMPPGLSQAGMGFKSFPDKPHWITELSVDPAYDWQVSQSEWREGDSRILAFVRRQCMLLPPLAESSCGFTHWKEGWAVVTMTVMTTVSSCVIPPLCQTIGSVLYSHYCSLSSIFNGRYCFHFTNEKLSPHRLSHFPKVMQPVTVNVRTEIQTEFSLAAIPCFFH